MLNTENKKKHARNVIINDFIESRNDLDGCGYFKGDKEAIEYAQTVGKNQILKFKKHGIVPKALITMIAQYWSLRGKDNPIYHDVTYGEFLTLLMHGPHRTKAGRQICEKFYKDLLTKEMPWLGRSFVN